MICALFPRNPERVGGLTPGTVLTNPVSELLSTNMDTNLYLVKITKPAITSLVRVIRRRTYVYIYIYTRVAGLVILWARQIAEVFRF